MNDLKNQIQLYNRLQGAIAAAAVLLLALAYFAVLAPLNHRAAELDAKTVQTTLDLSASKGQASRLPAVQADLNRLRSNLADFKPLPDHPDLGLFVTEISNYSHLSGVHLIEDQSLNGAKRTDEFVEAPYKITFEGDFLSVFDFIKRTEDMPRLLRITNVDMHDGDLNTGTVRVDLVMNLYFSEG